MNQPENGTSSLDASEAQINTEGKENMSCEESKPTEIGKENLPERKADCESSSTLISPKNALKKIVIMETSSPLASENEEENCLDKKTRSSLSEKTVDDDEEIFDDAYEESVDVIDQNKEGTPKKENNINGNRLLKKAIIKRIRENRFNQVLKAPSRAFVWDGKCHDLTKILPEEDCLFLAKKFWIFTVEQILFVLKGKELPKENSYDRDFTESQTTKESIIEELMQSTLIQSVFAQETKKTEIFPDEDKVSIDDNGVHDPGTSLNQQSMETPEEKKKEPEQLDGEGQQQLRKIAMIRIMEWEKLLYRFSDEAETETKKSLDLTVKEIQARKSKEFHLEGPLSILMPKYIFRFFESVNIRTVDSLFSSRKTESSNLISRLVKWRKDHEMWHLKNIVMSRYLAGLCTRIYYAIKFCPPANEFERNWIGSCLCVLTGSSREFLINVCKFEDHVKFLMTKTKELSKLVVEWRITRGMQPLKGSGKVATISGWKTLVKETIDADTDDNQNCPLFVVDSKGVYGGNSINRAKDVNSSPNTDSNVSNIERPRKRSRKGWLQVYYERQIELGNDLATMNHIKALSTSTWSLTALKPSNVSFLNSIGIKNADEFFVADRSAQGNLVSNYIQWRAQQGYSNVQLASVERTLNKWTKRIEDQINHVENQIINEQRTSLVSKGSNNNTDLSSCLDESTEKISFDKSIRSIDKYRKLTGEGPLMRLSETTRTFLESMYIHDFKDLLKTPSSFIAEKYIKWRKKNGITTLKGNGAIATISGWKNTVRECSRLSHLKDYSNFDSLRPRKMRKKLSISIPEIKKMDLYQKSNPTKLFTKPCLMFEMPFVIFNVFNPIREISYEFKIFTRKKSSANNDDELGIYCSYLGSRILRERNQSEKNNTSSLSNKIYCNKNCKEYAFLPILPEIRESDIAEFEKDVLSNDGRRSTAPFTDTRYLTFCSKNIACGLIDVTRFNIFPRKTESRMEKIMKVFDSFISCLFCVPQYLKSKNQAHFFCESAASLDDKINERLDGSFENISSDNSLDGSEGKHTSNANVFPCFLSSDRNNLRYLLYINETLEFGQTIELSLGPLLDGHYHHKYLATDLFTTEFDMEKNIRGREYLINMAKSLSLRELQHVTVSLHGAFKPIDSDVKLFLRNRSKVADESSRAKILKHLIICRRFNWIAETLNAQMNELVEIYKENDLTMPSVDGPAGLTTMKRMISQMVWKPFFPEDVEFLIDFSDGYLLFGLQQEISEEILSYLSNNNLLLHPFDDRFWCQLSSSLLFDLLDYISSHILLTSKQSHSSQWELFHKIVHRVNRAIELVEEASDSTRDIHLGVRKSRLEDLSFIPANLAISPGTQMFSQLCELNLLKEKNHSSCSEVSFDTLNMENILVCEKDLVAKSLSDVLNYSSIVHKKWYISRQILNVAHFTASCGLVKWINLSQNLSQDTTPSPLYSLENLINTLLQMKSDYKILLQNIDFRLMTLPSTLFFLKPSPKFMTLFDLSIDKTSPSFPKSLPFFLKTVWPSLNSMGWRLVRKSPTDVSFQSPRLNIYKGRLDRRYIFLRGNCNKFNKLLNSLSNEKQIRMPWTLRNILIKSITAATNNDVKVKSKNTVKFMLFRISELILSQGSECKKRKCELIHLVIDRVRTLFDDLVVNYMSFQEKAVYDELMKEKRNCEVLNCEFFLRFAIMLPRALESASIKKRETEIIVYVVELILKFLTLNCDEYFSSILLPSHYKRNKVKPYMTMPLVRDMSGQSDRPTELSEHLCCYFAEKFGPHQSDLIWTNGRCVDTAITGLDMSGGDSTESRWDKYEEGNRLVFRNHIHLIEFLFCSNCFKHQPSVLKGFKKYYMSLLASSSD